jgi:dTDP-4-dehydrorhamnose reductase
MKVLLTGANGQVGWEIVRRATNHQLLALTHRELDITHSQVVQHTVKESGADIVINAAAYTAVDQAEQEPDMAFAVNRDGPANLAATCAQLGIPLLHLSTDYVFDGSKAGAYYEDDPVAPLGVYGDSKWQGEESVRQRLAAHLILRVSWIFGSHGRNFVKTMLRLAKERKQLRVVADQYGCPTYAGDIADVVLRLAERVVQDSSFGAISGKNKNSYWGTYHYCGVPATTWHGFAKTIIDIGRMHSPLQVEEIVPISTIDYPTPAARPVNSVLACQQLQERFAIKPCPWRDGLEATLRMIAAESL